MMLVDGEEADDVAVEFVAREHSPEVEVEKLLLGGVEAESGEIDLVRRGW